MVGLFYNTLPPLPHPPRLSAAHARKHASAELRFARFFTVARSAAQAFRHMNRASATDAREEPGRSAAFRNFCAAVKSLEAMIKRTQPLHDQFLQLTLHRTVPHVASPRTYSAAGSSSAPSTGMDHAHPSPMFTSPALPSDGDNGNGCDSESDAYSCDAVSDDGSLIHYSVCIGTRKSDVVVAPATAGVSYQLTAAHYNWLVAQGASELQYDQRVHTILKSIDKSGLARPDVSKRSNFARIERNHAAGATPLPIPRLWGQLKPSDFKCEICFVNSMSDQYSCTSFISGCSMLSVDTERSPVQKQRSGDYSCHLVQLGTHRRVYLIPCCDLKTDSSFALALVNALAHKKVHYHGGDDKKRLAQALGVRVSELRCTFVDMLTRFNGKGLADVAAVTFPGRCLCKAWTNSGWDVFPLCTGQAEYAAMDVAVLHAIVEDAAAEGCNELHVCRLQPQITSTDLLTKFSLYGTVTRAVKKNGENYGYVTFENSHGARAALQDASTATGIWIGDWKAIVAIPNRIGKMI